MNLLFVRFSLLLAMIVAIAGTSMVQGTESLPAEGLDAVACSSEPGLTHTAEPIAAQRSHPVARPTQRAVRWQSLLPGAFR